MSAASARSERPRFGGRVRNNEPHLGDHKLPIILLPLAAMRTGGQYGMVD
jgi:hypothetical protein